MLSLRCPERRMWELMSARGYCAHQRYPVWHKSFDPGGLSRDGAQPHFTPHRECRCAFKHWPDVRWNSSGVLRVFCGELVKLADTGSPILGNHIDHVPRGLGSKDEMSIWTAKHRHLAMSWRARLIPPPVPRDEALRRASADWLYQPSATARAGLESGLPNTAPRQ